MRQIESDIDKSYIYLSQTVFVTILSFITIPIIAHFLTPSEFGIIALIQIYSFFMIGVLNLGLVTGYERNYFQYESDLDKTRELFNSIFFLVAFLSLVTVVLVYVYRYELARIILNDAIHGNIVILIFLGEVFSSLSQYFLQYLKFANYAFNYIKITILRSIIYTISVLILLNFYNFGIVSVAYAILFSGFIMFLAVIVQQFNHLPFAFNATVLKEVLKLSLPLTPRILFGFLNSGSDKIMLGVFSTMGGVGIYSVGQKISNISFVFMTALDHVFIPKVYQKLFSNKDENSIADYLLPFFYISILITLLIVLFSEELFHYFMPKSYGDAAYIAIILCVYYASMFFGKITGTLLIFSKKTFIISLLTLSSIVINIILNIPMIYLWGAIGAAWATSVAGIINVFISFVVANKYRSIQWRWDAIVPIILLFFAAVFWGLLAKNTAGIMYEYRLVGKIILLLTFIFIGLNFKLITKNKLFELLQPVKKLISINSR